MKRTDKPLKDRGFCYVCGKPTKFPIHRPCIEKIAEKNRKKPLPAGSAFNFSQQQVDNHRHNHAKKQYVKGYVPKFCFD